MAQGRGSEYVDIELETGDPIPNEAQPPIRSAGARSQAELQSSLAVPFSQVLRYQGTPQIVVLSYDPISWTPHPASTLRFTPGTRRFIHDRRIAITVHTPSRLRIDTHCGRPTADEAHAHASYHLLGSPCEDIVFLLTSCNGDGAAKKPDQHSPRPLPLLTPLTVRAQGAWDRAVLCPSGLRRSRTHPASGRSGML
nr:hypothetical protein CFP56_12217 [Quercus suber]